MSEFMFNVAVDQNVFSDVVSSWLSNYASNTIMRLIANEMDAEEVAEYVAQAVNWSDVSDAIYEDIRDNNLEDIAGYISDDLMTLLLESDELFNLIEAKVVDVVNKNLMNRIEEMSNTINSQAIAIAQLTKTVDSMESKKFWKKLIK